MLEVLFTIIVYMNLPVAIASFIFAFILLRRSKNNPIYFNFGMSTLFLALWVAVTFMAYLPISSFTTTFWLLTSYFCGLGVMHFFMIFTFHYPSAVNIGKAKIFIFYVTSLLVASTIFVPNLYISESRLTFPFMLSVNNPKGLTIFAVYFLILTAISFYNLINSYSKSGGITKIHLKKIIIGTGIAILANLIFSVFIYYFSTFESTPIGVLFTFGVILYIYSILFSNKNI